MGIYKQPGKWECGPFALKHALLMRGILASEWEITRLAGTGPEGTDEAQLERAAAHYGCDLPTIRKLDFDAARAELIKYLHHGNPCLLCVDGWDHWVTAVHEEKGQFIILDSEKPEVIVALDWPRLEKLWVYHEADDETARTLFDLHPLIPKGRARMRARFSLERAACLRQPDNHGLAQLWDVYAEDLIALCRAAGPRGGRSLALGEFLRRHEEMLVDQLDTWHGQVERSAAEQVLGRMRFVADTYGLVIRQRDEKRTIAAVSVILALWSAGEFGVAPLYRKVPVRKLR
ncbi:MAG: hypothetical protein JSU87_04540 [Gemmatimonadota bacterium]|nr:MAG: hypothetical protein JSU87_04540 [Gemmatimonadota bacterium]